jgi:Icc-related predicted phosphoesterase
MKIVATSDTHYYVFPEFIPDGDVFIHAGDLLDTGEEHEWATALNWLSQLPHKYKYFIPGNHDKYTEQYRQLAKNDLNSIGFKFLGGDGTQLTDRLPNGMIIGGCPYITNLHYWSYNRSELYIKNYLEYMGNVDILVCHSPAYGFLDQPLPWPKNVGSTAIEEFIATTDVKYLIHGHIHESYGYTIHSSGTRIYNVAMCDGQYQQVNKPIVIEI